ncbi:hypothetical protein BVG16_27275 [Paenibacillus selenitireducens]|uniref:BD-FAE-like domain-containing protein n=1 Tax=Paenibacillus selenitireducens TaxID=1324314 RepID=A0A1T2X1P0_9BACL|nr:alpha/beta hydrolase [Paenibacillus selenitireducens]OPA73784.1 hypothetical protein BVG16_27275 [Paenibacillus selenitireducens]
MKQTRIYKELENCSLYADVFDQGRSTPVIVYFHGGALIFGSKSWLPQEQIEFFTNAGFSVISIDYRLAPETKMEWIIEDIRDALTWVKNTAIQWYDFDASQIILMGSSAGGYLSLLAGTMGFKAKAIVSFYGYGDILGDWLANPSEHYCSRPMVHRSNAYELLGDREITDGSWDRFNYYLFCRQQGNWVSEVTGYDRIRDKAKLTRMNPIQNLTSEFPPTLLLHGNQDTDVPYEQSVIMNEKLQEYGVDTRLITIEGGDHGFDQHFHEPSVQRAFHNVVDFLRRHLA